MASAEQVQDEEAGCPPRGEDDNSTSENALAEPTEGHEPDLAYAPNWAAIQDSELLGTDTFAVGGSDGDAAKWVSRMFGRTAGGPPRERARRLALRYSGFSKLEDCYQISEQLGEGTFGEVFRGQSVVTNQEVALKKITIHDAKDGLALTTLREIKLLKILRHPSVVKVIDMAYGSAGPRDPGGLYMVEPYMDHDLAGLLDYTSLDIPQIKLYTKQLFEGTEYLHRNRVLHRDIKSANLLIDNKGNLQIADFGLARSFDDGDVPTSVVGGGTIEYTGTVITRWYRPPEVLAGMKAYGPEIDMWGLGCILLEMFFRKPFFMGSSEINQLEVISEFCGSPSEATLRGWSTLPGVRNADAQGRVDESATDGRKDFGDRKRCLVPYLTKGGLEVPAGAADLADKLLVLDPAERMTAKDACDHEWFWQPPYPADGRSLKTYPARKERDRKRKEQAQHAAKDAAAYKRPYQGNLYNGQNQAVHRPAGAPAIARQGAGYHPPLAGAPPAAAPARPPMAARNAPAYNQSGGSAAQRPPGHTHGSHSNLSFNL